MALPFTHDPSLTSQFKPLSRGKRSENAQSRMLAGKRVVVVGGGTGAPMSIRCLLSLNCQVNAVVAMADDGGSTGELRKQAGVTPPGDVRKCLAAFAAHPQDTFAKAFKYRFPFADNHALGNLLLAALEDASGSFPEAIAICEQLLQAKGHVFPSTLTHVNLVARTVQGHIVQGQACACHSLEPLAHAWLQATHEGEQIKAYKPALTALQQADFIVLGPGSLFTSIIANLLVPGVTQAIGNAHAPVIYVSCISDVQGETRGFGVKDQVQALIEHGMENRIDYVLADLLHPDTQTGFPQNMRRVSLEAADKAFLEERRIPYLTKDFYNAEHPGWHSASVLRSALEQAMLQCLESKGNAQRSAQRCTVGKAKA